MESQETGMLPLNIVDSNLNEYVRIFY